MFYKSKYFQAEKEENFLVLTIASKENPLNNLSDDFSDRFEECILNATKEKDLKAIILTALGRFFQQVLFYLN